MGGLGISVPTLLAQIVNFLILLGILYAVAYKPFMRMADQRSAKIRESVEEADKVKAEAAKAEEDFQKRLESASKEGQDVIAKAMRAGEEARARAQEDARKDAQALVDRARTEIQRERDEAIGELRGEFADLTILAAEKVIEKSLDKKAHQDIIEKVLEESVSLKPKQ